MNEPPATHESNVGLAWARLLRISAAPSAIANILAGYLVQNGTWEPGPPLVLLCGASLCLYLAGMVSNDLFDRHRDAELSPSRPLVTGAVSVGQANFAYLLLLGFGNGIAAGVGLQSLLVALSITVMVWLYNGPFKTTPIAPWIMGSCRFLNILLGASFAVSRPAGEWSSLSWFATEVIWVAIGVGVLISGLTLFARHEHKTNRRNWLLMSAAVLFAGIALIGTSVLSDDLPRSSGFLLLLVLVTAPILIRIVRAVIYCEPLYVKMAVITVLRSLILFDAAICFLFGEASLLYPLVVAGLIIPSTMLGRWISST